MDKTTNTEAAVDDRELSTSDVAAILAGETPEPKQKAETETQTEKGKSDVQQKTAEEADGGEKQSGEQSSEPGKTSAKDRIKALTREKREAERRAKALEDKLDRLAPLIERLDKMQQEKATANGKEVEDSRPDPDKYDLDTADPEYLKDLAEWVARQTMGAERAKDEEKRQKEAQEKALEAARAKYLENAEKARAKYDDYDDVVTEPVAAGEFSELEPFILALVELDEGPDVLYDALSDSDLVKKLSSLTPAGQVMEAGRLSAKHSAPAAPETEKKEAPVPKAQAPVTPAKGGGSVSDTDEDGPRTYAEFKRLLEKV